MNPNKALWEEGDFTRVAASLRENGEALVRTVRALPVRAKESDMFASVARRSAASVAVVAMLAGTPAQAIVGGTATTAFEQVGKAGASAVQITPNWVLTANHVSIAFGGVFSDGYGSGTVAAVYPFTTADFPENDLKLLRLDAPIAGAPALSLLANVIPDGSYPPFAVTIATGRNQVPRGYAFAELREVATLYDPDDSGPRLPVEVNWLITAGDGVVDGPYGQRGDSGGGLFLGHVTDSISPLMGITSAGNPTDPSPHTTAFVQLSKYRGWIDRTMAADLNDPQTANWVWVTLAVPEPAAWALWLSGLGIMPVIARRRRRTARV